MYLQETKSRLSTCSSLIWKQCLLIWSDDFSLSFYWCNLDVLLKHLYHHFEVFLFCNDLVIKIVLFLESKSSEPVTTTNSDLIFRIQAFNFLLNDILYVFNFTSRHFLLKVLKIPFFALHSNFNSKEMILTLTLLVGGG